MNTLFNGWTLRRRLRRVVALALLGAFLAVPTWSAAAQNSAVILQYHRFGEGDLPTTNVTLAQGSIPVDPFTIVIRPTRKPANGQSLPGRIIRLLMGEETGFGVRFEGLEKEAKRDLERITSN